MRCLCVKIKILSSIIKFYLNNSKCKIVVSVFSECNRMQFKNEQSYVSYIILLLSVDCRFEKNAYIYYLCYFLTDFNDYSVFFVTCENFCDQKQVSSLNAPIYTP